MDKADFIQKYPLISPLASGTDGEIFDSIPGIVVKVGDIKREIYYYNLLDHPNKFKIIANCVIDQTTQMFAISRGIKISINAVQFLYESLVFLSYLEDMNIAHCDIKPENIVQYKEHIKFIDFGLMREAEVIDDKLYITGIAYTEEFKDPEYQDDSDNPIEVELYALAATVYSIYAGEDDPVDREGFTLFEYPQLNRAFDLMSSPLAVRPDAKFLLAMSVFDQYRT